MSLIDKPSFVANMVYCLFLPLPWLLALRRLLSPRHGIINHPVIAYIILLIPASTHLLIHAPLKWLALCFILMLAALSAGYRNSFGYKMIVALAVALSQFILEQGCTQLMAATTGSDVARLNEQTNLFVLMCLLKGFLSLAFYQFAGALADRSFWDMTRRDFIKFFVLPLGQVITLFLFVNILVFDTSQPVDISKLLLTVTIGASFIVIDLVMLATFRDIAKGSRLALSNQYLEEENHLHARHLEAMQHEHDQIETMRQEISDQLATMTTMLKKKAQVEATAYNEGLIEHYGKKSHTDYSQHRVINAVLHNKAQLAERCGIELHMQVLVESEIPIDDLDLMCVFSNLLDNAIEACQGDIESAKRYINISARMIREQLVVSVVNSKSARQQPSPAKQSDGQVHGIGLLIVNDIAERYNGHMETIEEPDSFHSTVSLSLSGAPASATISTQRHSLFKEV